MGYDVDSLSNQVCLYLKHPYPVQNTLLAEPVNDENLWFKMRAPLAVNINSLPDQKHSLCFLFNNSTQLSEDLHLGICMFLSFTRSSKGGSSGDVLACLADKKLWSREVKRPLKTWQGPGRTQLNLLTSPGTHTLSNRAPCCPFLTFFVPRLEGQISREPTRINGGIFSFFG